MKVRFGYVAMSVVLENASPSRTVTVKTYNRLAEKDPAAALSKVRRAASENLGNSLRILKYNRAYGVQIYRFSSKIIPLATHPLLSGWNYAGDLINQMQAIGDFVKENEIRVTFHPDHYTLINSPRKEVFISSLADLGHHCKVFEAMGLDEGAKLIIHAGGGYKDKSRSLEKFRENWGNLPVHIARRITLENDDRTFSAGEVLCLCHELSLPMVFDIHHHKCNNEGEDLKEILPSIFSTWSGAGLPPKVHISSPKSPADLRSHHDFINPGDLYPFLLLARELSGAIDVMVEAKQKDRAMFLLVKELAGYPGVNQTGDASLEI